MKAEQTLDGIPVNPVLPEGLFTTFHDERPPSHAEWVGVPFVLVVPNHYLPEEADNFAAWINAWPTGNRYDAYCLDGRASHRPTSWGKFPTLEEAIECIKAHPLIVVL